MGSAKTFGDVSTGEEIQANPTPHHPTIGNIDIWQRDRHIVSNHFTEDSRLQHIPRRSTHTPETLHLSRSSHHHHPFLDRTATTTLLTPTPPSSSITTHHQMMYCLRPLLPLLLLPLPFSLSPLHLTTLLILTYILNRPCIYCSFLLVVLFGSSCAWQDGRCFWSLDESARYGFGGQSGTSGNGTRAEEMGMSWAAYFLPRLYTTPSPSQMQNENAMAAFMAEITNSTLSGLATAAKETSVGFLSEIKRRVVGGIAVEAVRTATSSQHVSSLSSLGDGIGTHWLKNLLGRSEWTLPCVGVKVVI